MACFIAVPMSFGPCGAAVGDGLLDDRPELLVGELGGQVGADQLALGLLAAGEILAPAVAEGLGGLETALALAAQHGELVVRALLGGLLQLGEHEPQRPDLVLFPGAHRVLEVGFDLLEDRHALPEKGYAARPDSPELTAPPAAGAAEAPGRGGVAPEEERDVPVGEQAQPATEAGHEQQVVGAGDEPRRAGRASECRG